MVRNRSTYIGSSDAPAIVGVPAYGRTGIDVWEEKVGLSIEPDETSAMSWGTRLEPLILAAYTESTGIKVDRRARFRAHPEYPFIGATIDSAAKDRIVEATFSPFADYGEPGDGEAGLPPYVRVQVKHQMMVTGFRVVDVPVLVRGYDLRIFTVEADPGYETDLTDEEVEWWRAYVVPRIPPPEDDPEALGRFLNRRHAERESGATLQATPEVAATLRDLHRARLALDDAKVAKAVLEAAIKDVMGEATILEAPGVGRVTWKTYPKTDVEWKMVAAAYRRAYDSLVSAIDDEAPLPERADLDAVQSLYTTVGTTTRFTPKFEGEPAPQEGPTDA